MIPASVIESIKQRCDIESVISSYVTLKRAGNSLKGLCPFHSEKTPSFTVFPDTQNYYCFGCGAGGDVITFVMQEERLDYLAAIETLAKRAGVAVSFDTGDPYRKGGVSRQRVLQMNLEAAKYFRELLFHETMGAPGREYLQARGLSGATVRRFGLGYAPLSGKLLTKHLSSLGFTNEEMHTAYFSGQNERGTYDYFRGRVMFPIIDVSGNVVAFGGRVLDDSKPKYLNTSNTPAFVKGRTLFALNYAKNHCENYLILCEGYLDVITMHQAGFPCAVATLGTAVTPEHARVIKKYTSKVILSYDSDEAGVHAANRAIGIMEAAGVEAKVLKIEGAKDPDEFIKKYGAEKFSALLEGSRSKFDYFLENISAKYNMEADEEKIRALNEVCGQIASVYSSIEREIYTAKAAKVFGVALKSVENDVERLRKRAEREKGKKRREELIRTTSGLGDTVNPDFAKTPRAARLEEDLLGMAMLHPELLAVSESGRVLEEEDLPTELGRRLFGFLQRAQGDFSLGAMSDEFTGAEISRASYLMVKRRDFVNTDAAYREYLRALREENSRVSASGAQSLEEILAFRRKNNAK